jgi:hypothetical protein
VLAEDDVARLEVAVQHPSTVRVLDRVADVGEPPQEVAEGQRACPGVALEPVTVVEGDDGVLEGIAADEPHGVKRAATGIGAEPIDGHNAGVFEPAGDLGLDQEPLAAVGVVGVVVEDLLQRHLAVQLGIQRHEDGAQSATGVGPKDAEA